MRPVFRLLAALALAGLATPGPARAAVIIGNLPPFNEVVGTNVNSSNVVKALGFTMGAGSSYLLDSVTIRLNGYDATDTPVVQIRDDTGGLNPGTTVLTGFTNPAAQGTGVFSYLFLPTTSLTLQGGTTYWLTISTSSGGFIIQASSPGITPTGAATYAGTKLSGNGGTTYSNSSTINSFQIDGTLVSSVPEPGPMALGAVAGAAGLAARVWSRRLRRRG